MKNAGNLNTDQLVTKLDESYTTAMALYHSFKISDKKLDIISAGSVKNQEAYQEESIEIKQVEADDMLMS